MTSDANFFNSTEHIHLFAVEEFVIVMNSFNVFIYIVNTESYKEIHIDKIIYLLVLRNWSNMEVKGKM